MARTKKKKMTNYKRCLIIFALLLLIAGQFALIYVYKTLVEYEKGHETKFMTSLVLDLKKASKSGKIDEYLTLSDVKSDYEKVSSLKTGYKELLNDAKELTFKKVENTEYTYDLYADNYNYARVYLKAGETRHRLGLLNYTLFDIDKIEADNSSGLYTLEAYISRDYTLEINGFEVNKNDIKDTKVIDGYEEVDGKTVLPEVDHYVITKLTTKPKVKVLSVLSSNTKEVNVDIKNGIYYANNTYYAKDMDDANKVLKHEFNPLTLAEKYSLFLSADLSGSRWGFYQLSPYLVQGTTVYTRFYAWATNVDITFTSSHTLDKPPFTNEKIENIEVYDENTFACDIYLEKNMTLKNGNKKVDVLYDRFYFTYMDNQYRLVKMVSLERK